MKEPAPTKSIVTVALVVIIVLLFGWMFSQPSNTRAPETPPEPASAPYEPLTVADKPVRDTDVTMESLANTYRTEYVNGCMTDPAATENYCVCTYNHMHTALGTAGLIDLSLDYVETNVLPPEMLEAAYACLEVY